MDNTRTPVENLINIAYLVNGLQSTDEMRWHDYMIKGVGEDASNLEVECWQRVPFFLTMPLFFVFLRRKSQVVHRAVERSMHLRNARNGPKY